MDAKMITAAALDVLDDVGLDKLSMRLVAGRLGVQVGGLYYYVADKAALLRYVADAVCAEVAADFDAQPGTGDATALCWCLRTTLNRHRDAARVLAASPFSGSVNALALMDRLIELLEPTTGRDAGLAADTLMSYVTGYVFQEQQAGTAVPFPVPIDELRARYPRVFRAAASDDDASFGRAVTTIASAFST